MKSRLVQSISSFLRKVPVSTYSNNIGEYQYYGAASPHNAKLRRLSVNLGPLPTGEVEHPTRQSVEAIPDITEAVRGQSGRSLEDIENVTGNKFHQSRPQGHFVTQDTYQGSNLVAGSFYMLLIDIEKYLQLDVLFN